jgi:hypothetical protein
MDRTELARLIHENGPIEIDFMGDDLAWRPSEPRGYAWAILTSLQGETDSGPVVVLANETERVSQIAGIIREELAADKDCRGRGIFDAATRITGLVSPMTDLPTRSEGIVERLIEPDLWMKVDATGLQTIDGAPVEAASHIRGLESRIGELERTLSASAAARIAMASSS